MSMSVGASSSNSLSYLQSLMQQGSAKEAKKTAAADPLSMLMQAISGEEASPPQAGASAPPSKPSSGATCPPFSSDTMSALLSAQGDQSPAAAKLFSKLDANGDGQISKDEFSTAAAKAGADSSVADAVYAKIDGDSDGVISQGELTKADQGGHHHHRHADSAAAAGSAQEFSVTETSDSATSSTLNKSAANLLEQLIKLQSQVLTVASSTMSAIA